MLAKYEQSKGKMISFTGAEAWLCEEGGRKHWSQITMNGARLEGIF